MEHIREEGRKMIIGIDIGGTNVRYGAVDKDNNVFDLIKRSSSEVFSGGTESFVDSVGSYIRDNGIDAEAVSIGLPSIIDRDKRKVLSTANISCLQDVPLASMMESYTGVPCFLNHDVKNLLEYDIDHFDIPVKDREIIGFYVGTGFGTVFCIDGRFLKGMNGGAGEMGHMPYPGNERICGCGKKGCVETIAAGRYLSEIKDKYYKGESFSDLFTRHSEDSIIINFIENMAFPIATAVSIFDPDCIVLGGGVIQTEGFPKKVLEAKIRGMVRSPLPSETLVFRYSPAGQENGIIGAALYARKQLGL